MKLETVACHNFIPDYLGFNIFQATQETAYSEALSLHIQMFHA
jgi:hypothetical protein